MSSIAQNGLAEMLEGPPSETICESTIATFYRNNAQRADWLRRKSGRPAPQFP